MKLNLPDSKPLAAALAAARACPAKLTRLDSEKATMEREIEDFITNGDPSNETRLHQIAGLRTRLDMYPHVRARQEAENQKTREALEPLLAPFEEQLAAAGMAEYEATRARVLNHIRPFIADAGAAEIIAGRFPVVQDTPRMVGDMIPQKLVRDGNYVPDLESAEAVAEGLLALHAEVTRRGRFSPEPLPK